MPSTARRRVKSYLITHAQNATPVEPKFWASLQTYCKENGSELIVIPGRYKNPTSVWSAQQEHDEWWDLNTVKYLCRNRRRLCKNLQVFADISIQPTANRPLSGMEVYLAHQSGIFGHTKRALEVVPTGTRTPRVMWTTSACTKPNYTSSKAGKRGDAHHVYGALVVEVDDDACYFVRHVTATKDGAFTDLDKVYSSKGVKQAPRAASAVLGDWHAGLEDFEVLDATKELLHLIRPREVFLHDVLDFSARNHHNKSSRFRFEGVFGSVEEDVIGACDALKLVDKWGRETGGWGTNVVRSNHDEFFERWLEEHKDSEDPYNAPYYHEIKARDLRSKVSSGEWLNLFESEARRHSVPAAVRFLRRNESFRILGVEHGFHGDKGPGGSRGTPNAYVRLGAKFSTGHTHVARICDGSFVAGVTAQLDHGYNLLPSAWVNAHTILHQDGKRQLIIIVKGRFRGAARKASGGLRMAA